MPIKLLSLSVCAFLLNILSNNCIAAAAAGAGQPTSFGSLSSGQMRLVASFLPKEDAIALSGTSKKAKKADVKIAPVISALAQVWNNTIGTGYNNLQNALFMINDLAQAPDKKANIFKSYINPRLSPVISLPTLLKIQVDNVSPEVMEGYRKVDIVDFRDIGMEQEIRNSIQAYLSIFHIYAHKGYYQPTDPAQKERMYRELRRKIAPEADDVQPEIISVANYLDRPAADIHCAVYLTKGELRENKRALEEKLSRRVAGGEQAFVNMHHANQSALAAPPPLEGPSLKPLVDVFVVNLDEGIEISGENILRLNSLDMPIGVQSVILISTDSDTPLSIAHDFMTDWSLPTLFDLSNLRNVRSIGSNFLTSSKIHVLVMPFENLEIVGDDFMADTTYAKDYYLIPPSFSKLKQAGDRFYDRAGYDVLDLSKATALEHIGRDFCALSKIAVANLSGLTNVKTIGPNFFLYTDDLSDVLLMGLDTQALVTALRGQTPFYRVYREKTEEWFTSKPTVRIVFDLPVDATAGGAELGSFPAARTAWSDILSPLSSAVTLDYVNTEYPFSEKLMKDAWAGSVSAVTNAYQFSGRLFRSAIKEAGKVQDALTSATFAMHAGDPDEE